MLALLPCYFLHIATQLENVQHFNPYNVITMFLQHKTSYWVTANFLNVKVLLT